MASASNRIESPPREAESRTHAAPGRRWHGSRLRALLGWTLGLLAAVLAGGCSEQPSVAATPPARSEVPVQLEVVEPRVVTDAIVVPGLTEAKARIELAFRVGGFVARFHVEEGDRVERGALLAELDLDDLARELRSARAAWERARAHAAVARQQYERQQALLAERSTSRERLDRTRADHQAARSEVRQARVALETAEDRLAKGSLRAPLSGWVERRLVEPHERVGAERPVLVLSDLDPIVVRAAVADALLARLRVGGEVRVRTPLWPERSFTATLRRIAVAADAATRTVPFEAEIANPELTLRPELAVEVEIPTGDPAPVLAVPLAAVLRDASASPFCFVASEPEPGVLVAERREVVLGAVHGTRVVVEKGLSVADRLVTRGQHFLREGDALRALEE